MENKAEDKSKEARKLLEQAEKLYADSKFGDASVVIKQVLDLDEDIGRAWQLAAELMVHTGDWEKVSEFIQRALLEEPDHPDYMALLAETHIARKNNKAAKNLLLRNLDEDPKHIKSLYLFGELELAEDNFDQAENYFQQVVNLEEHADAYNNLGCIKTMQNLNQQAIAYFNKALEINEELYLTHGNIATLYIREDKLDKAEYHCIKAIKIKPEYADAHDRLGLVYKKQNKLAQAKEKHLHAISLDPHNADPHNNLGSIFLDENDLENAEKHLSQALNLRPESFDVIFNSAACLYKQQKYDLAKSFFEEALKYGENWECHLILNLIYQRTQEFETAMEHAKRAAILSPNNADIIFQIARLYKYLGNNNDARKYYKKSLKLEKKPEYLLSQMRLELDNLNWDEFEKLYNDFNQEMLDDNIKPESMDLFDILVLPNGEKIYSQLSKKLHNDFYKNINKDQKCYRYKQNEKIKIGYISPDFNFHPITLILDNAFLYHNREQFEIYAYNLTHTIPNPYTKVIESSVDHFVDIYNLSTQEAADRINDDGIDILVDLAGHTRNNRLGILAKKPAPIQAHWLGYAESTHMPFIDYFISDETIINAQNRQLFSEEIIYLPQTSVLFNSNFDIPKFTKKDFGLPENKFIFCNFSQPYRISKGTMLLWLQILDECTESILWLHASNEEQKLNIIKLAEEHNISKERFIFADNYILTKYWQHQVADCWLDPLIISSGTAVSLSLEVGLPFLTYCGAMAQQRVAASMLKSCNLEELIASDKDQYLEKAIAIYNNPELKKEIKNKINKSKIDSILFDAPKQISNLEQLYLEVYRNFKSKQN
jgi:protein O-GlcNAc transferase